MAARSKAVAKVIGTLRVRVPAGGASPSPPLGPALGQVRACVCVCVCVRVRVRVITRVRRTVSNTFNGCDGNVFCSHREG